MGSNMNICVPEIYHNPQLEVCNALLLVAHCSPIVDYVNSPTGSPRGQRWPYLSKAKRLKRAHLHVLKPPSHVPSVIPVHPTRIVPSHPTPVSPCVEKSDRAKDFRAVPRARRWLGLGHVTNSWDHSSVSDWSVPLRLQRLVSRTEFNWKIPRISADSRNGGAFSKNMS